MTLGEVEITILEALKDGPLGAGQIRPMTRYENVETVRRRCAPLVRAGLVRTWKQQTIAKHMRRGWSGMSKPVLRLYALTQEGVSALESHRNGRNPPIANIDRSA